MLQRMLCGLGLALALTAPALAQPANGQPPAAARAPDSSTARGEAPGTTGFNGGYSGTSGDAQLTNPPGPGTPAQGKPTR